VLELVERVAPDGLDADEAGAKLHELNGAHEAGQRCQWCGRDGRHVLKSLARHGLVVRKRRLGWFLVKDPVHDPATAEIPF
jgi:hypothetical protein